MTSLPLHEPSSFGMLPRPESPISLSTPPTHLRHRQTASLSSAGPLPSSPLRHAQ